MTTNSGSGRFSRLEKVDQPAAPIAPPPGTVARATDPPPATATPRDQNERIYPEFVERADELFYTGNYREALRNYSRALQEENNHVYPWIGQVSALIELKQYREAELWSNKALEQFPEDSSLLAQRARVLACTGDYKRALGVSDYSLKVSPTEWAWLARGEVLLAAGKDALPCFDKAVEMAHPDNWRVPLQAGLAFARRRQWANALEMLDKAVQRNSRSHFAWYQMALVLVELSYPDRAKAALERVAQLKPEFQPARDLMARLDRRPFFQRVFGIFKR